MLTSQDTLMKPPDTKRIAGHRELFSFGRQYILFHIGLTEETRLQPTLDKVDIFKQRENYNFKQRTSQYLY